MKRLALSAFTFALLSIGYALYARVVVPRIEPPLPPLNEAHLPPARSGTVPVHDAGGPQKAREIARDAFGPESPEVKAPFVWQFHSEHMTVYFFTNDYEEAANNHVLLEPLSMVVHQTTPDAQTTTNLTTLQCPRARIEFDKLDMKRLQAGKPIGGLLEGAIEIRHFRPADDRPWVLRTRDVRFLDAVATAADAPPRLATDAPVEFSHGQDRGGGEGLDIFLTAPREQRKTGGGLAVSGIASLRIRRNVRFVIEVDPKAASFGRLAGQPERKADQPDRGPVPLEVRCGGPFQYSLETETASFRNAVEVLHQVAPDETERLQCDQLDLLFARNDRAAAQGSLDPDEPAVLTFRKLRAAGKPVLIHSPPNHLHVLATFLSYDAERGQTVLANDDGTVSIVDETGEIHAGRLTINQDDHGDVASVLAEGPGRLWRRDEKSAQDLRAQWSHQLSIGRDGQLYVLRLRGRAALAANAERSQSLEAEQIDLWLRPKQNSDDAAPSANPAGGVGGMDPVKLDANGAVKIDAPQLSGNYDRLEMFFEEAGATAAPAADGSSVATTPQQRNSDGRQVGMPQGGKLRIDARFLHVQFFRAGSETRVSEVRAQGSIDARQEQAAGGEPAGLVLRGETLRLTDVGGNEKLRLTGSPAQVRTQEMALSGKVLLLNRAANRLDVDGAGVLVLAVDRDFDGRPLDARKELEIRWAGGLVFDGTTAVFRDAVQARLEDTRLLCHQLDAILERPIAFTDPPEDVRGAARIRRLVCNADPAKPDSKVELIKEVQRDNRLAEYQYYVSPHLVFESATGDIQADGPGFLVSVAPGDDPGVGFGFDRPRAAAQRPATAEPGLKRLQVRYTQSMTGNINRNRATFRDRVEVLYGPVARAEQTLDPHRLPDGGLWLRSEVLEIAQEEVPRGSSTPQLPSAGSQSPMLLIATGNVKADVYQDGLHSAQAHRISYSEQWDRLIVEGHGAKQAKLWRQTRPGGVRDAFSGDRITYHPRSQKLKVDGATVIEGRP